MTKHGQTDRMDKKCGRVQAMVRQAHIRSDMAKKRIVRMRNVTERGPVVEGLYGKYPEPASEPCAMNAA